MSVSRRKTGLWLVKYKDEGGVWRQRSFPADKEFEARQYDLNCRFDEPENERMTVAEAVLAYLRNTDFRTGTIQAYKYTLMTLAAHLKSKFVDALTRRDLESVRENARRRGNKPTTINIRISNLNAAFNWCVEQDLIKENPWAKYRRLPGRSKNRTGTLEDFKKVYPHLPEWMQWACRTSLALCLRPGMSELFSLRWSAFDWSTQRVNVYMPKTRFSKAVYPPPSYLSESWERFTRDGKDCEKLVCRNRLNRPVTTDNYKDVWHKACQKAGVQMPLYALRHIAASEMLASGVDIAVVAAQLGHQSVSTTMTYYAHTVSGAQQLAAPKMAHLVQFGAVDIPNQ